MLAYGGSSIKKNGIYDEEVSILKDKNILPEIAESCNASPGSYGDMNTEKILNILNECF